MEIIERIEIVFRSVFDDKKIKLFRNTRADDIPAWDSLIHMTVISEVEEEFKINFTFNEVGNFTNIGDICDCVALKLKGDS